MTQNGETMNELLVLDPRRDGWAAMVAEAGMRTSVLLLDRQRDGLNEILDATRGGPAFTRIRIAGSGSPGRLGLGGLVLDMPAMAQREAELARLGERIAPGGMLELCGGGGGASAAGGRLVAALARLLRRDVGVMPAAGRWMPTGIETQVPAGWVVGTAPEAAGWHRQA